MMQTYKAQLNNVRLSPQKMRLVVDMVRGKNANEAVDLLRFANKKGAGYLQKLIVSAIANAKNNYGASTKDLVVKEIFVTEGMTYKRGKAVARGRYFRILKRNCNVSVELQSKHI